MAESPKRVGLIGLSAKGSWASQAHLPYFQRTSRYKITALGNSSQASGEAAAKNILFEQCCDVRQPYFRCPGRKCRHCSCQRECASALPSPPSCTRSRQRCVFRVAACPERCGSRSASTIGQGEESKDHDRATGTSKPVNHQSKGSRCLWEVGKDSRDDHVWSCKHTAIPKSVAMTLLMSDQGLIFGGILPEDIVYMLPVEAGANLLTIPFGHAVDALCYVLDSELGGISATLSNHYPAIDLVSKDGKPIEKRKKTSHDFISITASLVNGGGNVAVTYAPGTSRSGRGFYWEIIGSEGTLVLEGPMGHVQMFQPTVKLAVGPEELKEIDVEKAADFSFNVGKAWDAWAGIGGRSVTTWQDALIRHKMIEAIYRSAEHGTREDYV